MIISKTPYRISFFGGGTDYPKWFLENEGKVISTTINKHIYITCRKLPKFFNHNYRVVYSVDETVNNIKEIKHNVVREALKLYKISSGIEIHYDGDLPSKSGMGSSSSFVVGLLVLLNRIKNNKISNEALYEQSILLEQKILKENVGNQDQIASVYGGFNIISFNKKKFSLKKIKNDKFIKKLEQNLYLVYTGILRSADKIAEKYINSLKEKKYHLKKIIEHVSIAEKYIKKNQVDDFGFLLGETWEEKKLISKFISNSKIDYIYNLGLKNGAIGGKLLGAGAGGFLLFYVPSKNQEKFKIFFDNKICMKINFYNEGTKIIYSNEN
jgi:D-glycero-alpha-D-manno-heptose-7-phosphate kinase